MDFKSQLWLWIILGFFAVCAGGPIAVVLGMFIAWLMPFVILLGVGLLILSAIGHSIDKQNMK